MSNSYGIWELRSEFEVVLSCMIVQNEPVFFIGGATHISDGLYGVFGSYNNPYVTWMKNYSFTNAELFGSAEARDHVVGDLVFTTYQLMLSIPSLPIDASMSFYQSF